MPKVVSHLTGETLEVSEAEAKDLLRMGIASVPKKETKKSPSASPAKTKDSDKSDNEEKDLTNG